MSTVILNKKDHPYNRALKEVTSKFDESLLSRLFDALQRAAHKGIETDHSVGRANIRTLDLGQIQSLMHIYCNVIYKRGQILGALQRLKQPRSLDAAGCRVTSEIDGDLITGIRLQYTYVPVNYESLRNSEPTEDIKAELSAVNLSKNDDDTRTVALELWQQALVRMHKRRQAAKSADKPQASQSKSEIDKCDASRRWIDYAMTLEEQYTVDQEIIANLRAVITELSEVLYEADADARISLSSHELLDIMQSKHDVTDTPF